MTFFLKFTVAFNFTPNGITTVLIRCGMFTYFEAEKKNFINTVLIVAENNY